MLYLRTLIAFFTLGLLMFEQVGAMPMMSVSDGSSNSQHSMHQSSNIDDTASHHNHESQSAAPIVEKCHDTNKGGHCANCDDCQCFDGHCSSSLTGLVTVYFPAHISHSHRFSRYNANLSSPSRFLPYRPPIYA